MNGNWLTVCLLIYNNLASIITSSPQPTASKMFKKQPQNVLTRPAVNVTIYCVLSDPNKHAIWCQNGFCTMGKTRSLPAYPRYSIIGDPKLGEHNLFIENVQESDMGSYQCQVPRTSPDSVGLQSRVAYLTIIQRAKTISMHKPLRIWENEETSVTCLAEYSYPASRMEWQPEEFVKQFSLNTTQVNRQLNRTYWSTESTVSFIATPEWQGQRLDCWVIHEGGQGSGDKRLVSTLIQFPTLPLVKIHALKPINNDVISVPQGQLFNLSCEDVSVGSADETRTFRWSQIYPTIGNAVEISTNSTIFLKAKKSLQNALYKCEIENMAGSRNASVKLNVLYGPLFYTDKSKTQPWVGVRMQLVQPDQTIDTFGCYVDSNPLATIRWLHGNQIVSDNGELTRPDLITSVGQIQEFQCVAIMNGLGTFARTLRLVKDGSPIVRPISQDVVDLGSTARLVCAVQIIPKFNELFWTNGASNRFISVDQMSQDGKYRIEESWTDEEMYSILFISSVTKSDIGLYNCCALNEHGMSSASVWLVVYESSYLGPLWSALVGVMILTSLLSILVVAISMYKRKSRISSSRVVTVVSRKKSGASSVLGAVSSNGTVGTLNFDANNWMPCPPPNGSCWYGGMSPFPIIGDGRRLSQANVAHFLEQASPTDSTDSTYGFDAAANAERNNQQTDENLEYRQQSTV